MKEFKGFKKGINLGGWMSQCDYSTERLENFITEDDIRTIAGWGADHVRLPIDFNVLETEDGGYSEKGFGYVQNAVDMCLRHGLNIVIDLHKTAGFSFDKGERESGFFDSPELQERFYRLWEQIAQRFGKYPDRIAFELLNEVTDKSFIDTWNRVSHECIKRIRKYAPKTTILVGSYWNNSVEAVADLYEPYDENVVYNFHCYDPLEFTHQHAHWVDSDVVGKDMSYDESGATPEYFEKLFESAIRKAEENNTTLYCGEYGVIENVGSDDALSWLKAINSVFESKGIGRSLWSYKEMNFGVTDSNRDAVRSEFLKYI